MLENQTVDLGDINQGEDETKSGNDGPEKKFVLVNRWKDGEDFGAVGVGITLDTYQAHVEERGVEVFDFPGSDKKGERKYSKDGGAGLKDTVAGAVVVLVAVFT